MGTNMKITKEWLVDYNACRSGTEWFIKQRASKLDIVVMKLLKKNRFDWANWVLVRFMSHTQKVTYAAFAAKQVLHSFEEKYPNDKRPRKAIKAALRFVEQPPLENQNVINAVISAAISVIAAYAVSAVSIPSAYAAYAVYITIAAYIAYAASAAYIAYAAYAAYSAYVVSITNAMMKRKIIVYGLKLLAKGAK